MPTTKQMTYAELAAVWGVSSEAARKKVEGLRLPRATGNDGKVRVMIDLDEVQHRPAKSRSERKAAGDRPETESLRQHIVTLQAEVGRLASLAGSNRADFERERIRAERATSDLSALACRLIEAERDRAERFAEAEQARVETQQARANTDRAQAEVDAVRAELAALRARPWWQRMVG